MSRWPEHELRAVLEDAHELAFIGGETLERATARIKLIDTESQLEKLLYENGRHDIVQQFARNSDRVRVTQGVIR